MSTPDPAECARLLRALVESPEEPSAFDSEWLAVLDEFDRLRGGLRAAIAAELRRLADVVHWCDDTDISQEVDRELRARADEMDPRT